MVQIPKCFSSYFFFHIPPISLVNLEVGCHVAQVGLGLLTMYHMMLKMTLNSQPLILYLPSVWSTLVVPKWLKVSILS